jgi:hypothetical protein
MTQDDLPPVPWTVRQFEHAWEIRAADGGLICFVQSEPLARAIAAIPEMRATIKTQHGAIFALNKEIDRLRGSNKQLADLATGLESHMLSAEIERDHLRADNAELLIALESFSKIDDADFDRIRELGAELDQLRAEKEELIEMLATRTTHPEYMEVLRRYRHANETEA